MEWLRRRRTASMLLWAYLLAAAALVLSPVPLTRPLAPLLHGYAGVVHEVLGVPAVSALWALEFTANVALFVPPALLLTLWIRRRVWLPVFVAGIGCSVAIELIQLAFLPGRSATIRDVVANSLGALIGSLVALRLRGRGRPAS